MIDIEVTKNPATEDVEIHIKIPRQHILLGKRTRHSQAIADLIDTEQFFGMLRDAIDMKLGIDS
jgi:hypothetical protein